MTLFGGIGRWYSEHNARTVVSVWIVTVPTWFPDWIARWGIGIVRVDEGATESERLEAWDV